MNKEELKAKIAQNEKEQGLLKDEGHRLKDELAALQRPEFEFGDRAYCKYGSRVILYDEKGELTVFEENGIILAIFTPKRAKTSSMK